MLTDVARCAARDLDDAGLHGNDYLDLVDQSTGGALLGFGRLAERGICRGVGLFFPQPCLGLFG